MENKIFLTIDSGGTKTQLTLYNADGTLIKSHAVQGFGKATDSDNELIAFSQALQDFCQGYAVFSVVCNLGGKNKREFALSLEKTFPLADIQLFRESEGKIGLTLCSMYSAQMVLMAGTGSIAIAPVKDKTVVCGGWGANISDKGSGYQVGLEAVQFALEELDGVKPLSMLTKAITGVETSPSLLTAEEYCEFRDRVRANMSPLDRAHIASFSKIVYECATQGDRQALSLYEKVGSDLADMLLAVALKTNVAPVNIVVTGGMINAKAFWQATFERKLKEKYNVQEIYYLVDGIDIAMKNMAKKEENYVS